VCCEARDRPRRPVSHASKIRLPRQRMHSILPTST
jgi:hypothetical protein